MGWVAHFDNSDWNPIYGTWDGSEWDSELDEFELIILQELGSWASEYRPTKIRITFTDVASVALEIVDTDGNTIGSDATYSSGQELDIDFDEYALDLDYIQIVDSTTSFSITNIEFDEGGSSSSSSSSSYSESVSSSSSSSSSRSSSSSSSSSSSRSSSSSSSSRSSSSSSSSSESSSSSSSAQYLETHVTLDTEIAAILRKHLELDTELAIKKRNSVFLDIEIVTTSHIWGTVRDWKKRVMKKSLTILASSLDGSEIYGVCQVNPNTGYFMANVPVADGIEVLITCFNEGTYKGQLDLAGSLIVTTGSSSCSSSSSALP